MITCPINKNSCTVVKYEGSTLINQLNEKKDIMMNNNVS